MGEKKVENNEWRKAFALILKKGGRKMDKDLPIAVFDSGIGGISVLSELLKILPKEDFIYFGDRANAPYGIRSAEEVRALTVKNFELLLARGIKAFVIACNTATSVAVKTLRERYPDLVIIGVEPALKPAALCAEHPTVAVLATPLTLKETKFSELLKRYSDTAHVIPFACAGLVELIERGVSEGEELESFLSELLSPLQDKNLDCAVLGCTHYPLIKDAIGRVLGERVKLFDGGYGTARETRRRLEEIGALETSNKKGRVVFIDSNYPDSDAPEESMLRKFGEKYLCL